MGKKKKKNQANQGETSADEKTNSDETEVVENQEEKKEEIKTRNKINPAHMMVGLLVIGLIGGFVLGALAYANTPPPLSPPESPVTLEYYYSPTCEACLEVTPWIKEFANKNDIDYAIYNIAEDEGMRKFNQHGFESVPSATIRFPLYYVGVNEIKTFMPQDLGIPVEKSPKEFGTEGADVKVFYFYGTGCGFCDYIYEDTQDMLRKYSDEIEVVYYDVYKVEGGWDILETFGSEGVPTIAIGDTTLIGAYDIPLYLEETIQNAIENN